MINLLVFRRHLPCRAHWLEPTAQGAAFDGGRVDRRRRRWRRQQPAQQALCCYEEASEGLEAEGGVIEDDIT